MRYEILGPLRVVDETGSTFISARKVETVLAALLIRAGYVVAHDQLIYEIWGPEPPAQATAGLHVYISQLRKFLTRPGRPASPIVTRPQGYLLSVGDDEFDVKFFQRWMELGRASLREKRLEAAVTYLTEALELWRGPILNDIRRGPIVDGFMGWVSEAKLECAELLAAAQLALGRHREIIGMLTALTAEHPLHESFYQQLMVALYRSRRRADALKVYQSARQVLNEQLGLEPHQQLQDLQAAILTADDSLIVLRLTSRRCWRGAGRPAPAAPRSAGTACVRPGRVAGTPLSRAGSP